MDSHFYFVALLSCVVPFFIHRIPCDYLKYLILLEGMCFILSTMEWWEQKINKKVLHANKWLRNGAAEGKRNRE